MNEHAAETASGFLPHGTCYLWNPYLLGLHVTSDAIITLAYLSIPVLLIYFIRKRRDVPFRGVFWMFGTFIVACGLTQLMGIVTVWEPWYWASGIVKAITAAASIGTAIALLPLMPKALTLKSPIELDRMNRELEDALADRDRLLALYEREHRLAGELQRAFLPLTLPKIPGMSFDAMYQAGVAESDVGGDWYDAFALSDGRIAISIGDVAGRGLHAAVTMGKVRQSFRVCALQNMEPSLAMQYAERMLELYDPEAMVTAFIGVFHPITRELTYCNAGHPPPVLATETGDVTMLDGNGVPLGVSGHRISEDTTVRLELGSVLALYTDGLVESRHNIIEGTAALVEIVKQLAARHSEHPADTIRAAMLEGPPNDDVAVLVLTVSLNPAEPIDITLPAVPESLRAARLVLRRFAYAAGCSNERTLALEIATGEAITNAIEHAYGLSTGTVRIVARVEGRTVSVAIEDTGTWRAPRQEGRGRGIPTIKALVTDFHLDVKPGLKRVEFTMPIEDPAWVTAGGANA